MCVSPSLTQSIKHPTRSSSPDTRFSALAFSTALPHAGDWLNSIPSISLGLHLHDSEFRVCLCYWLGLRIQGENLLCPVCSLPSYEFGDHGIGCGGNRDRIQRHDAVRDVLFAAAQTAALAPRKEVSSLIPNSFSRPADIFLPTWERGRPAALDVTIISPMQHQILARAATGPGHAFRVGEKDINSACSPWEVPQSEVSTFSHTHGGRVIGEAGASGMLLSHTLRELATYTHTHSHTYVHTHTHTNVYS